MPEVPAEEAAHQVWLTQHSLAQNILKVYPKASTAAWGLGGGTLAQSHG